MRDVVGDAWDDLLPHVIEDIEQGAFEMSKKRITVSDATFRAIAHAHGFVCDDEMPYLAEATARREEWQKLLQVPSYVETQAKSFASADFSQLIEDEDKKPLVVWMEDEPLHSFTQPFCDDALCPCHTDEALFDERIAKPVQSGLMKIWDAQQLLWPER